MTKIFSRTTVNGQKHPFQGRSLTEYMDRAMHSDLQPLLQHLTEEDIEAKNARFTQAVSSYTGLTKPIVLEEPRISQHPCQIKVGQQSYRDKGQKPFTITGISVQAIIQINYLVNANTLIYSPDGYHHPESNDIYFASCPAGGNRYWYAFGIKHDVRHENAGSVKGLMEKSLDFLERMTQSYAETVKGYSEQFDARLEKASKRRLEEISKRGSAENTIATALDELRNRNKKNKTC